MIYETILETILLVMVAAFVISAGWTNDPHKELRRLIWAGLLLLAYIADRLS